MLPLHVLLLSLRAFSAPRALASLSCRVGQRLLSRGCSSSSSSSSTSGQAPGPFSAPPAVVVDESADGGGEVLGADPATLVPPSIVPGAQHGTDKLLLMYTCRVCETRSARTITKVAYNEGVVLVRCPGCTKLHLVADRLGYFEDEGVGITDILAERGETVRTGTVAETDVRRLVQAMGTAAAAAAAASADGGGSSGSAAVAAASANVSGSASVRASVAAGEKDASSAGGQATRTVLPPQSLQDPFVFEFNARDVAVLRSDSMSFKLAKSDAAPPSEKLS